MGSSNSPIAVVDEILGRDAASRAGKDGRWEREAESSLSDSLPSLYEAWVPNSSKNETAIAVGDTRSDVVAAWGDSGKKSLNMATSGYRRWNALAAACLYADVVVIPDPLEAFAPPRAEHRLSLPNDPKLSRTLHGLGALEPLFVDGSLEAAPFNHIILGHTQVDLANFQRPPERVPGELPFLYDPGMSSCSKPAKFRGAAIAGETERKLRFAYGTGARLVPIDDGETSYLSYRARRLEKELKVADIHFAVVSALDEVLLPSVSNVDPKTLASIRRNEECFDAWRRSLRNAVRLLRSSPGEFEFAGEVQSVFADTIFAEAETVRRTVKKSAVLRKVFAEQTVQLGIAAGGLWGLSEAGMNVGVSALAGAAIGAGARVAIGALLGPRPEGASLVLQRLGLP